METIRATIEWTPEIDRFVLWADEVPATSFAPEPFGDFSDSLLLAVDAEGKETGCIAGVEMALLEFDRWEDLPQLDILWQLPGWEPLPLDELLKRLQKQLRAEISGNVVATN